MADLSDFDVNSAGTNQLNNCFSSEVLAHVKSLAHDLREVWRLKKNVYLIGNGGGC